MPTMLRKVSNKEFRMAIVMPHALSMVMSNLLRFQELQELVQQPMDRMNNEQHQYPSHCWPVAAIASLNGPPVQPTSQKRNDKVQHGAIAHWTINQPQSSNLPS